MKIERKNNTYLSRLATTVVVALTSASAFAASQTWTNAPVSTSWTNVNNWVAKAVPGAVNGTGNGANADTATFNSPIVGGFGSAANPIAPDDATTAGNRSRAVLSVVFDNTNCGAYYFASPSPAVLPGTGIPATGILYVGHNGALRINPPVTNSQTFLIPMYVLLPSSTAGIFNLVNNSTNPNAALYVSQIIHGGSTTRATTFILDGTNTAANIVTNLSEGGGNATGGFTKQGNNTWIIAGPGTFPAASPMNINAGTLAISDASAFGVASTVTINSNATFRVDSSVTPSTAAFTVQRNGTIKLNTGTTTINGVTVGTAVSGTSPTLATTSSSDVMTVGSAPNKVTGGALDSVIHISGPGTVSLAQDNNYLGKWTVDAGTLAVTTANGLSTGQNLNIAAGATLDLTTITAGGGTYALSTVALSASGTGISSATAASIKADAAGIINLATGSKGISLTFAPTAFTGDTTHPALYISQGTLSLAGNAFSINNASGSPLGVGTYRLIQQATGNITDGGGYSVTGVTGSGLVSGNVASVSVSGGDVILTVSPYVPKNLVWKGSAATWDIGSTSDWLNGAVTTIFNNSDNVTFNSTGIANPTVTLVGTLAPSSVTVDTAAGGYTFNGGQIAGGASLLKTSAGTLILNEANTYGGGTVVSNGTLKVGINNAVSATGAGDVRLVTPATLDLSGFNNTINGLNGNGTVDVTSGGTSLLTLGENGNSGIFTGAIKNTSGTLALTKDGTGVQTLSGSNSYVGATTINAGSLRAASANAIGAGGSAVTVNVGSTLDVGANNVAVASITGIGTVANNTSTATNTLVVNGTSSFAGTIADGSAGGQVALLVNGGVLSLTAGNSYSGGTTVASGAGLIIGNSGSAGAGGIIASNSTRVGFNNANNPAAFAANNLTTVDGATMLLTGGGNQANNLAFQFFGSATATNVLTNACSIGGASSFAGFNGTVIVAPNASARFFNALGGGDNTTFDFQGGNFFSRDANTIRLGALQGGLAGGGIGNPSVSYPATYIIGGKGLSTTFSGNFNGSNNLVKIGAGSLTFNNSISTTNTDNATFTNILYTSGTVAYLNNTTISNGTLAFIVPNNLNNSPNITLAGSAAVLDASKMGYITNFTDGLGNAASALVTNGILEILATTPNSTPQVLGGFGSITGKLLADSGSTLSPGLPTGTLTVSGTAEIAGAVVMNLSATNTPNCSTLAATAFTIDGTATLVVTNVGPGLFTGTTFTLFNHGVSFPSVTLPNTDPTGLTNYVWTTNLTTTGSITLASGGLNPVATNPTNITSSVSGNVLTLTWPADHTGWRLQVQTNTLGTGLNPSGTWYDVTGATTVNTINQTINPANGTVFYRMVYP
jgi:autotransporter-associated beta strand protein